MMDYPAVNIAPKGVVQGLYFPNKPGPYDNWAIAFGYDDRMSNINFRQQHLARSSSPDLRFGNDADSMVKIESGIDPRVNVFDLSNDPIEFSIRQNQIVNEIFATLPDNAAQIGKSWDNINRAFFVLLGVKERSATTISRYIGGVYVDRSFVGQKTASKAPFMPVEYKVKKRAMAALNTYLFAPNAFSFSKKLISHLQKQRRGFDFHGYVRQDPLIHARIRAIQEKVLRHLLNHRVLRRLTDSELYGNKYSVSEMLEDLTQHIFKADLKKNVNSFRRNLQVSYVKNLLKVLKKGQIDAVSEGELWGVIRSIDRFLNKNKRQGSKSTQAHRAYLRYLIKTGLEK
jgi:hypothetical protein